MENLPIAKLLRPLNTVNNPRLVKGKTIVSKNNQDIITHI